MLCIKMMHRVVLLCLLLWWCVGRAGKYDIEQSFINLDTGNSSTNFSTTYTYKEGRGDASMPHSWVPVRVTVIDAEAHQTLLQELVPHCGAVNTTFFVPQPVYISLTTMASRMHNVSKTITGLLQARLVPTRIYLVISKNPHLLDEGVKTIPENLLCLQAAGYLSIIFTSNLGPHRKLLPVLRRYWNKDVFIATVDDDMGSAQAYVILYQLLKTYTLNDKPNAVVALRARRIAFCATSPHRVTKYHSWPVVLSYNKMEMLLLPTGTGGVLYQPKQFTKLVLSKPFWYATGTADDMMFRLAAMVKNIPVLLGCSMLYQKGRVVRSCSRDSVDRMYDSVYGPNSTMYYNKLLAEVPKRVVTVYNITNITYVDNNSSTSDNTMLNAVQISNTTVDYNRAAGTSVRSENGEHLDVLGALDSQRQLYNLKSALKRQQRSGNETELFTINRNGGNDLAWKALFKFNFDSVVRDNIHEREDVLQ